MLNNYIKLIQHQKYKNFTQNNQLIKPLCLFHIETAIKIYRTNFELFDFQFCVSFKSHLIINVFICIH